MLGSAAINMGVQFSLLYYDIYSFGYMPKIDIAREDHMLVLILAFLRCLYTDFHSGYTNLYPTNSRFPFNLHSHQHCSLISFLFFWRGRVKNIFSLFIYSYVYTLGHFSPLPPTPPSPPLPPIASRQNLFCPFLQFC
jgi:hypothetical protein